MPRHRKDITEEELAEFRAESERKRKISLAKAKAKYQKTEKGKAGAKKYYLKNQEQLVLKARETRKFNREKNDLMERFFLENQDKHPEFFQPVTN